MHTLRFPMPPFVSPFSKPCLPTCSWKVGPKIRFGEKTHPTRGYWNFTTTWPHVYYWLPLLLLLQVQLCGKSFFLCPSDGLGLLGLGLLVQNVMSKHVLSNVKERSFRFSVPKQFWELVTWLDKMLRTVYWKKNKRRWFLIFGSRFIDS
jgi:hypothetical protein